MEYITYTLVGVAVLLVAWDLGFHIRATLMGYRSGSTQQARDRYGEAGDFDMKIFGSALRGTYRSYYKRIR
ncbi:MAG: hypothetical protein AAFY91_17005 [Bacteroidota bacterium]